VTDSAYENGGLLRFRVKQNTSRLEEMERWRREVDVERATLQQTARMLKEEVHELTEEVKGLRRILFAGTVTAACGTLTFALTVLAGTGRI